MTIFGASTTSRSPFFRKVDWASFWTATVLSFIVYFLTLGPSVGLEDSGELAVAGDHLGVPHPPGYPIWTIISFCFARIFDFVTFRGQPNPAWAIALSSAVFGALASGCTAMLITRSASDMLADAKDIHNGESSFGERILCWVGGVAGSLIFAFSPVMWSQSTIVEVYSLGAFFLMLVMLLIYRWMRRPSDRVLWLTAFVFGLGLTNYQVLLLAALPLVIILFLRNIALFRDFIIVAIPIGLAAIILKLGSLPLQRDLIKQSPILTVVDIPSEAVVIAAVAIFAAAFIAMLAVSRVKSVREHKTIGPLLAPIFACLMACAVFILFIAASVTTKGVVGAVNPANVALMAPTKYVVFGALFMAICGASSFAALFGNRDRSNPYFYIPCILAGLCFLIALFMAVSIEPPRLPSGVDLSHIPTIGIAKYNAAFVLGAILLFALSFATKGGLLFALPILAIESVLYILVLNGVCLGLTHPTTWWFWAPVIFNFFVLGYAALTLPSGVSVAMTFLMGELGVSFYAYMPIVSDLRNPPMNWGYPRTWEGFKHAITRGQYEKITPTDIFAPRFIEQIGDYFIDLRRQFTLLLAPLGFLPFAAWRLNLKKDDNSRNGRYLLIALGLSVLALVLWGLDHFVAASVIGDRFAAIFRIVSVLALLASVAFAFLGGMRPLVAAFTLIALIVVFVLLGNIPAIEKYFDSSRIDKLAFGGLLLLCFFGGLWFSFRQFGGAIVRILHNDDNEKGLDRSETITVGIFAAAGLLFTVAILFKALQACLVYDVALGDYAASEIVAKWATISPVILQSKTFFCQVLPALLSIAIVASVIFGLYFAGKRRTVSASMDDISQQWLIGTVCNFLVMSILLIMLANPRGDLQDTFIQKVKFISSHGLFALWIGYGLIFAVLILERFFSFATRNQKVVKILSGCALLCVFLSAAIPIQQNYFNDKLVFELSGAEQNGHDYGWQFGNYQLRGADAIMEELEEDEEPLPNPSYPPAMGQGAVFFGGTDPGRFVPTYMIYSADVRPDVFLITQNALADNTFMSVTRDLYGDQLWIPTPKDSENAFSVYVDEVNAGIRPQNADLIIENGRVQIVGALGVMEINGILCKMIFEHNKPWHKFYVEESYVIPWMYPYLTPHGLIMHINPSETSFTAKHVTDDRDFWDWYVRRLTRDGKFRRDIVAQKSFSKLRSAIAGLYVNRNRFIDAEQAYTEARILYPVSPEANFRCVQDILMRQGRIDEALAIVNHYCERDPNNDRGPMFRDFIVSTKALQDKLALLRASTPPGMKPTVETALQIAEIEIKLGNTFGALHTLTPYIDEPKLSIGNAFRLANLLFDAQGRQEAVRAMSRVIQSTYVQNNPDRLIAAIRIYAAIGDVGVLSNIMPRYLSMRPNDWNTWLDWATLNAMIGKTEDAMAALERGLAIGGQQALSYVERNQTLIPLVQQLIQMRQQGMRNPQRGALPMGRGAMPFAPMGGGK